MGLGGTPNKALNIFSLGNPPLRLQLGTAYNLTVERMNSFAARESFVLFSRAARPQSTFVPVRSLLTSPLAYKLLKWGGDHW